MDCKLAVRSDQQSVASCGWMVLHGNTGLAACLARSDLLDGWRFLLAAQILVTGFIFLLNFAINRLYTFGADPEKQA